ncbi:MAG: AsmA-like C-terminal region, partial [Verrucomicrobiota bacterium]
AVGVGATTYELDRATGTFGCLSGRAYFPDLTITGPQARLELAGEVDLKGMTLDFVGDLSLPRKQGFNPLDIINLNRALVSLTKIKLQGPLEKPETRAIPSLKDIVKPNKDNNLGKIPAGILE